MPTATPAYLADPRNNNQIWYPQNRKQDVIDLTIFSGSRVAANDGLVPAPAAGSNNRYLKCDGTWDSALDGDNLLTVKKLDGDSFLQSNLDSFFGQDTEVLRETRNTLFFAPNSNLRPDVSDPNNYYYYNVDLSWNNTILKSLLNLRYYPFKMYISFMKNPYVQQENHWLRFLHTEGTTIRYIFNFDSISTYEHIGTGGTVGSFRVLMKNQQYYNGDAYISVGVELTYLGLFRDGESVGSSNPYIILISGIG